MWFFYFVYCGGYEYRLLYLYNIEGAKMIDYSGREIILWTLI